MQKYVHDRNIHAEGGRESEREEERKSERERERERERQTDRQTERRGGINIMVMMTTKMIKSEMSGLYSHPSAALSSRFWCSG